MGLNRHRGLDKPRAGCLRIRSLESPPANLRRRKDGRYFRHSPAGSLCMSRQLSMIGRANSSSRSTLRPPLVGSHSGLLAWLRATFESIAVLGTRHISRILPISSNISNQIKSRRVALFCVNIPYCSLCAKDTHVVAITVVQIGISPYG